MELNWTAAARTGDPASSFELAGAVLIGDQALSEPLQNLVSGQADIRPIRERLLQPQTDVERLLTSYWQEWRTAHAHL